MDVDVEEYDFPMLSQKTIATRPCSSGQRVELEISKALDELLSKEKVPATQRKMRDDVQRFYRAS